MASKRGIIPQDTIAFWATYEFNRGFGTPPSRSARCPPLAVSMDLAQFRKNQLSKRPLLLCAPSITVNPGPGNPVGK